ncbi:MAG: hypothetical protein IKU60_01665 [Clostridia bacterium]|nr:hypothetical protein [Clostridia bacterium]
MIYERQLTVEKDGIRKYYIYYVKKVYSEEFCRDMYNVGIEAPCERQEINDFSPNRDEAVKLCKYLYDENITVKNLFSAAEEFIVTL